MERFIDIYNRVVKENPDKDAFISEGYTFTYAQLDEASARIYAYLKDKGIGKEDFVQVVLPRDARIAVALTGIIKAGAAFVLLEDTYPKERIDFIGKDCGCKMRLDDTLYDEIMVGCEPLFGNESTDVHDACYAVYTSGSTGSPKGVLHEYGNMDQNVVSFASSSDDGRTRSAVFAPFYFVAGVLDYGHYISRARTTYIIPHELTRDFMGCKKFIEDNGIEEMYLPPSLLRIYKEPAKCLKVLYTGSEPANGLSYNSSPVLVNFYAMSESGFVVLSNELDKPYDVAPVGKPLVPDIGVCLIDEDGKVVEGAGRGELCFKNEYVRGYINLPEMTANAWRDGLFHTNDCAQRDDDGRYRIVGRYDDMIKINGNRVEPVEIEAKVKNLTGLSQVVAKGFSSPERSYICLYYPNGEAKEKGLVADNELVIDKDALRAQLPDYMVPTYYVGVDSFPLTATGKISRKDLKAPDTNDYVREYVAPETDLEKLICKKMAEVLKLERVGVTDDFYSLGGDSMRVMMLITVCNEAGVNITSAQLYDNRTPKALAAVCEGAAGDDIDAEDAKAMKEDWELLSSQKMNLTYGMKADKTNSFNLRVLEKLKDDIDPKRLAAACNKVLASHPGMRIKLVNKDDFYQRYDESFTPDVTVQDVSEEYVRNEYRKTERSFDPFKEKMYSCTIFRTECANYLALDVHHAICDATSKKLITDQVTQAYFDDNYEVPKDYYFYMLSRRYSEEIWEKEADEGSTAHLIKFDHQYEGSEGAAVYRGSVVPKDASRDGSFFATALAMAIAKYNGSPDIRMKEVYAGRNEVYTKDIAGELAIPVTIDISVTADESFADVRSAIREQELYQIAHPANHMRPNNKGMAGIRFNYQKNTFDRGLITKLSDEDLIGRETDSTMHGTFSLNMVEIDAKDSLDALIFYNTALYERSSMEKIMDDFLDIVKSNL